METKKISIALLVLVLSVMLVFSANIVPAYAVAGFQNIATVNISGAPSSTSCGGIAILPSSSYVIMQCDNALGTTQTTRVSAIDGTAIATSTLTVGTGETANTECVAVSNTVGVCSTGRKSSGLTGLSKFTVTSSSTISRVNYLMGCTAEGGVTFFAGNSYFNCGGTFKRISLSSMAESGSWTGLDAVTCTTSANVEASASISVGIGVMVCNSTPDFATVFTYSGNSGTITKHDSVNLINDYSSIGAMLFEYANGYLYIGEQGTQIEAIPLNIVNLEFTGASVEFNPTVDDIQGAGNYFLTLDSTLDQYSLIDKSEAPPTSIVVTGALGVNIGGGARMYSSDSVNFVISKGANGNTDSFFLYGTGLRNENDIPVTGGGNSGGGNQENGVCGLGTALECVGNRGTINAITGAQELTTVVTDLGNGLGIFNSTNTDPETNGSGLFLMLATGAFFFGVSVSTIGIANSRFNANIQYSDSAMHPYYLLFLVAGVISLSWYLNWIPDIVFYTMVIGIAGLFSFGMYKQFRSG